jgi:hypothetical protein
LKTAFLFSIRIQNSFSLIEELKFLQPKTRARITITISIVGVELIVRRSYKNYVRDCRIW